VSAESPETDDQLDRPRYDRVTVQFEPRYAGAERTVFERVDENRWERRDQVWTGCSWRTRGIEDVRDLAVVTEVATEVQE